MLMSLLELEGLYFQLMTAIYAVLCHYSSAEQRQIAKCLESAVNQWHELQLAKFPTADPDGPGLGDTQVMVDPAPDISPLGEPGEPPPGPDPEAPL